MYSKPFELSNHDIRNIWLYFAYVITAILVLYGTNISTMLVDAWISEWVVSWWIAMALYVLKKFLQDNSMEDPLSILDWSKEWDDSDDDMLLEWESEMLDKLSKVSNVDDIRISYDQYADPETKSACTLFSPLWVISSIFNKRLSFNQIMDSRWFAVKNFWYKKWQWQYFEAWVRCIVKRWNTTFPDEQVMYFKSKLWSPDVERVLEKWYWICWWYKWNVKYSSDRMDWTLDWTDFWVSTYWHATSVHLIKWIYWCYDSMPKMMKYIFWNHPSKIKWWYSNCYVILPVKEVPKSTLSKLEKIRERRRLRLANK